LTAELIRRGYSDEDIIKVIGGNVIRAFQDVEKVAQQLQSDEGPSEALIPQSQLVNVSCRTDL
jgi:membrane dipeptidase